MRLGLSWIPVACAAWWLTACALQQPLSADPLQGQTSPTAAPTVNGQTITGANFSWTSVRGHVVVLDFWASWCGPCRAEQPAVNKLYTTYASRGVVFLGVDVRDDNASAVAFHHDFAVPYVSLDDATETIAASYDVAAPPTIVLIDQHGDIVATFLGTVTGLSADLNRLL